MAFMCALIVLVTGYFAAVESGDLLEQASQVSGGGFPYAAGIFVFSAAVGVCLAYLGVLLLLGWNSQKALSAIQLAVLVGCAAAVLSSIAFIAVTGLFNATGAIGVILAITGAPVVYKVAALIKNDLAQNKSES
ncbi:hypothetical protein [Corynebacterium cystitidis]|uniref:hypothetical protein n=1 Tax=Corynebacterium cystitidis TaxID=35757 RepID=UPI00211EC75C|nr:hypothetical protein [Corynebacterium cystitidis]